MDINFLKNSLLIKVQKPEPHKKTKQTPFPEQDTNPIQDPMPGNEPVPGESFPGREPMIFVVGVRSQIFL